MALSQLVKRKLVLSNKYNFTTNNIAAAAAAAADAVSTIKVSE